MTARVLAVADLFCGAGGFSTGARRALEAQGLAMKLVAVNHWQTAVATHTLNHPEADHFCVDVYKTKPREAVPSGRLDLLMASPTCTFFSRARGGRPISFDQRHGRMTPTQVYRWCKELDVQRLLVENVPEFVEWGPVDRATGRPRPEKRGLYFRAWIRRLERLGFTIEWKVLNAADFGDATTRKRFFLQGRRDGETIAWPRPSRRKDAKDPRERWKAAREVIDWKLKGRSIFTRAKPLSRKTLARIYAGAMKFGWPEPFLVILRRHMDGQSVDGPLPAITAGGTHIGLAQPVPFVVDGGPGQLGLVFQVNQGGDRTRNIRSVEDPVQTIVTRDSFGMAEPFVLRSNMHKSNASCVRSVDDPLATVTTDGGLGMAQPFMLSQASGGAPRATTEPVPTIPTDGAHALISAYYGNGKCRPVDQPLATQRAKDCFGLVMPVTHDDKSNRARSLDDPLPAITCAPRGEHAVIVAAFGERPTQAPRVHSVEAPAPTIAATGRIQLAEGVQEERGYDILFRMLEPHELAGAMGFEDYEFMGTKTEVVRQIGNAVPVATASALVTALLCPAEAAPKALAS